MIIAHSAVSQKEQNLIEEVLSWQKRNKTQDIPPKHGDDSEARNLGSEFNVPSTGNVAMTAVEATLSGSCPHHANKRRKVTLGCMWQDLACTSLLRSRVFLNGSSMFTPKLRI
jgi:hypothetical protein